MIKNLMLHYKEALTTLYNPTDPSFEWFRTEEGEIFGIHKSSLTADEKKLLSSLFQKVNMLNSQVFTPAQQRWFHFLFTEDTPISNPAPNEQGVVRFTYFYLKQPLEDKQNFEEAVKGLINSDLFIWLSESHGIIIDERPSRMLEANILKDFSSTLLTDFYVEPYLYIGQLQKNDAELKTKFLLEYDCFNVLNRSSHRAKAFTFYEALPSLIILSPTSVKKDILSNALIEAIEDTELYHTMEAFFQSNLNASSAAKQLFIHRNSLQYRIEKIVEKTGLDIRDFSNATFIFLAILLVRSQN